METIAENEELYALLHPDFQGEAHLLSAKSDKKVLWKSVDCEHSYYRSVKSFAKSQRQCPYCSNKELLVGFNDLHTVLKQRNLEEALSQWNETFSAKEVLSSSAKQYSWACVNNHHWEASALERREGRGFCKECRSLSFLNPKIAAEWDYNRNSANINAVHSGTPDKYWWIGSECSHSWEASVRNRVRDNQGCPYCANQKILQGYNDLLTVSPEIAKFWDHERNEVEITTIGKNSKKKYFWKCDNDHFWEAAPSSLTHKKTVECPTCISVLYTNPEKAEYWNTEKNNPTQITSVSYGSEKIYWWFSKECGHEWKQTVESFVKSKGCQVCNNKNIVKVFNDIETSNPSIFVQWNYSRNKGLNPHELTAGSNRKVWWICENGHEWEAIISDRNRGSNCPNCYHRFSKAEEEIREYLDIIKVSYISNDRNILDGKELDIYIPEANIAIEFNGIYWHSEDKGKNSTYHYDKWKKCKEKGIQLLTIWEDDWRDHQNIVKNTLSHKLNKTEQKRIPARKTKITEVSAKEARPFLDNNHIQGFVAGTHYYALIHEEKIVAMIVLKKVSAETVSIVRYATSDHVLGGFSKLMSYSEKNLPYTKYETFADHSVSDGKIYEMNGFVLDYELKPDYMYVYNNKRVHKFLFRKARFKRDTTLLYENSKTEKELADMNSIYRIWDCGKSKYVKTTIV